MKEKIWSKLSKLSQVSVWNLFALMLVMHNVNVACSWHMHQSEVPDSAKKFIKE